MSYLSSNGIYPGWFLNEKELIKCLTALEEKDLEVK